MHATNKLWARSHVGYRINIQTGGIGRQQCAGLHDFVELREYLFFEIKVLIDRFDHNISITQIIKVLSRNDQ